MAFFFPKSPTRGEESQRRRRSRRTIAVTQERQSGLRWFCEHKRPSDLLLYEGRTTSAKSVESRGSPSSPLLCWYYYQNYYYKRRWRLPYQKRRSGHRMVSITQQGSKAFLSSFYFFPLTFSQQQQQLLLLLLPCQTVEAAAAYYEYTSPILATMVVQWFCRLCMLLLAVPSNFSNSLTMTKAKATTLLPFLLLCSGTTKYYYN